MKILAITLIPFLLQASPSFSPPFEVDEKTVSEKTNAKLSSGKVDDLRYYKIERKEVFKTDMESLLNSILNFDKKCNNELSDKRIWTDKAYKCPYANGNLIESKITMLQETKKQTKFIIERRIYNREFFTHVDYVEVEKGKDRIYLTQKMLSNKRSSVLLKRKFERKSAFKMARNQYILTKKGENEVEFDFTYVSSTDHWLLNKSVAASRVFDAMDESVNLLFSSMKSFTQQKNQEVKKAEKKKK